METYRIAIVDDAEETRQKIKLYLSRLELEQNICFEMIEYTDGADIAAQYCPGFDILLMDIEMPLLDGMKAARILRQKDDKVAIVFVTNLVQYAVQGYEVEAMDFIVKPLNWEMFSFRMKRILNRIGRDRAENRCGIALNTEDGIVQLSYADIVYVEVTHHTLTWHLLQKQYEVRGSITEAEKKLQGYGFCRSNQCYLINLRYVTGIREEEVQLGGTSLKVSRSRKKELVQALTEYNARR